MSSTCLREPRTIVVNFGDEPNYLNLINDGKAFIEFIIAFILTIGLQLKHKNCCCGGFSLTRHSHYNRILVNNLPIWRIQCTKCKAVFTVLPHFILRYRKMSPDVAAKVLLATHGGLSLENGSILFDCSPMAIYRLLCAIGRTPMATLLSLCRLHLPHYLLADEKHSHCLDRKVYLPTVVQGRVIWHLGYTEDKTAEAFQASYGEFKESILDINPSHQVRGILTDGFESTRKSLRYLFPAARLGNCLRHATQSLGSKLKSTTSEIRDKLKKDFYQLFQRVQERKWLRVFSLGQKLRRFTNTVKKLAGSVNGQHIKQWITKKKDGWFQVIADPKMPTTSTLLDQAHNNFDRKLFMMKGFHHPDSQHKELLNGLAVLYNFIPYQRRARNAGKCGVEVEGGQLPTQNWFFNLQIMTSGGFF